MMTTKGDAPPRRSRSRLLVPEIGLADTRQNRRWLAVFGVLADHGGGSQEEDEELAWDLVLALAATRVGGERRRGLLQETLRDRARGDDAEAIAALASLIERTYRETS